jgi:hypothetical protein
MKLEFHRGKNVGDAINPLIFEGLLGRGVLERNDGVSLLGIGSVIGLKGKFPGKKVVFSSGWADDLETYGPLPCLDHDWDVRVVRGPLTASALGLPSRAAVLDGAYLVECLWPRVDTAIAGRVGFIPHHKSLDFYDWEEVCGEAGLEFLDVRLEPRIFMERLWRCEKVVTEAMHGAIFADTYGIPWLPIRLYGHINEFKWRDWWGSLGLTPSSHRAPTRLHSVKFFETLIHSRGVPSTFCRTAARLVLWRRRRKVVRWLGRVVNSEYYLSDREVLSRVVEELHRRLEKLKEDFSGVRE